MDGIAAVFVLAVAVEKMVQVLKDLIYKIPFLPDSFRPFTLELISLGCGMLFAFGAGLDAVQLMGIKLSYHWLGLVVTGLVIGKGSNFAHDFFHNYQKDKK